MSEHFEGREPHPDSGFSMRLDEREQFNRLVRPLERRETMRKYIAGALTVAVLAIPAVTGGKFLIERAAERIEEVAEQVSFRPPLAGR